MQCLAAAWVLRGVLLTAVVWLHVCQRVLYGLLAGMIVGLVCESDGEGVPYGRWCQMPAVLPAWDKHSTEAEADVLSEQCYSS